MKTIRWLPTAILIVLGGMQIGFAAENKISIDELDGIVRVHVDGALFADYIYKGREKPIIYPILGPDGVPMTRNYPMKEVEGEAKDHPHHASMWYTHGNINGENFWNHKDDKDGKPMMGTVHQTELVSAVAEGNTGTIKSKNEWRKGDGSVICTDTRTVRFASTDDHRMIDWTVTMHASHGEVIFHDTKEGTMGIRTHPNLRLKNSNGVTTANGRALNSEGGKDKEIWGKRAKWVDYWGKIGDKEVGVAIFDHPKNPRHPTWWHARDYGLVAANAFGIHDFEGKAGGTGDFKIPKGESVTFKFRFVFHKGDADKAKINELYNEFSQTVVAQRGPRVLPVGQLPNDVRLQAKKDLNGYFPFEPPSTREAWESRADGLRRRILVATGLWPMPERTPLNAVTHGKVEREGFSVEKVYFESLPGHFVTGLVFRPTGKEGPFPAVLCPHGHGGRNQDHGAKIAELIEKGEEKFEQSGRFPKLARCATLARMGCVVFVFDMLGYVDSQQISYELAHRFAKDRPDFNRPDSWGFFSTQAELRLQTIMGLQTWNAIRSLDFLQSQKDVDASRMAVTGGSGGGTQTILLCAIDPRPVAAFPQGMVSTSMQGGCTCENCSLLRIGTGNVELAALFAPKPQAMTAANDWTKGMMDKGYPSLQKTYQLFGAKGKVLCKSFLQFPHNYNYPTRAVMYEWMNQHLKLGLDSPIVETDYKLISVEEMAVWNEDHPQPPGGDDYERSLTKQLDRLSNSAIEASLPKDKRSYEQYRFIVGSALETIIGRGLPAKSDIEREKLTKVNRGSYWEFTDLIRNAPYQEELPVLTFYPESTPWSGKVVLWLDGEGKSGCYDEKGELLKPIQQLLDNGASVMTADLLMQGDFLADGVPIEKTRRVKNPREYAGYTHTYNHTLFAQRVHDVLTLVSYVVNDDHRTKQLSVIGVNGAGPIVAAARIVTGETIDKAAVDTQGFRFAALERWDDPQFLPGAVKYGDLPAMLALSAPHELHIVGEESLPAIVANTYEATGGSVSIGEAESIIEFVK